MKRWILRLRLYRLAAWLYETYRLIAKPRTQGALVALWHQGRVLLVAASYRRELSLPGGWINRGETARLAAQRELAEELALQVDGLEILSCVWLKPAEALRQPITGHLREYLEQISCSQTSA